MKVLLQFLLLCFPSLMFGQVINGYAEVTGVAGSVLTLGAVDEAAHTFEDGDWVIVMQMQANTIGTTGNNAGFGSLGSIQSAGLYEVSQIASHTETAGSPTTVTLANTPDNTYQTCGRCTVQIITFREYGSPNYTTTANSSAKTWDGATGGVLAMYVPGTLTLGHNIDADQDGFRGAGPNAGGSAGCSGGANYRVPTQDDFADKGEGIYNNANPNREAGMGRILNGGGGGNSHNGGGGGGGNYTAGGDAGPGWPTCSPSAGGFGGLSLQSEISVSRIFMGGGGGAGEGNNNLSTDGGMGGGIVLIKANEIETVACAGVSITASGESISFAGNDGGGGGGAGGSIVFEVGTWNINGACPLTVEANGGGGGDVNSGATHGGGGGGGQGVVFYSVTEPTTNVTTNTNNGPGGCDNIPCTSSAGGGGGSDGDGVQDPFTGPLPISLVDFYGELTTDVIDIYWTTASESFNDYFTIEKSINGENWDILETVDGAGNSTQTQHYATVDKKPYLGVNYYRLKQTDYNGTYSYSEAIRIDLDGAQPFVFPNPASEMLTIYKSDISKYQLNMFNTLGQEIQIASEIVDDNYTIDVSGLAKGIYVLVLSNNNEHFSVKVSVKD